jgi:hypothetical protein
VQAGGFYLGDSIDCYPVMAQCTRKTGEDIHMKRHAGSLWRKECLANFVARALVTANYLEVPEQNIIILQDQSRHS